jgi:hypothetical protein
MRSISDILEASFATLGGLGFEKGVVDAKSDVESVSVKKNDEGTVSTVREFGEL